MDPVVLGSLGFVIIYVIKVRGNKLRFVRSFTWFKPYFGSICHRIGHENGKLGR